MPGEDNQPSSAQESGAVRSELAQAAAELRAWLSWSTDAGLRGFAPAPQAAAPSALAPSRALEVPLEPRAAATAPTLDLPDGDAMSPASGKVKLPTLQAVRDELGECTRCKLHKGRTHIVYGVGSERARLVFVGEAPGEDRDLSGEPFVGKAGHLLTRMTEATGPRRAGVNLSNTVKCRPPHNANPEPDELPA